MKITLNGTEYTIKYGYAPVLKNNFISEFAEAITDGAGVEKQLLFIPKALLIGLQVYHSDEFSFSNEQEKSVQEDRLLEMFGKEVDENNLDCTQVLGDITNELIENSFLKQMLEKEMQKSPAKNQKNLKVAKN